MTDTQYALLYSVSPANAHTALFNEYFNYVYSIVFNKLRSCGTKEDIEECVSDVFAAVFEKCPAIVFMIAGIFPVVPGAQIYWATYYLVTDQLHAAFDSGFLALKIMISIVLGIVVVFEIPYKFFKIR